MNKRAPTPKTRRRQRVTRFPPLLLAVALLAMPGMANALTDMIQWIFGGLDKRFYDITNYDFDGNKVKERRYVGKMTPLQLKLLRAIVRSEPPFESRIIDLEQHARLLREWREERHESNLVTFRPELPFEQFLKIEHWTATGVYEGLSIYDKDTFKMQVNQLKAGELRSYMDADYRIRFADGTSWAAYGSARIYDLETGVDITECRVKHVTTGHCQEVHNLFTPAPAEAIEFFTGLKEYAFNPNSDELWRFTPFDKGLKAVWPRWIVKHPDGYNLDVRALTSTIWMNAEWLGKEGGVIFHKIGKIDTLLPDTHYRAIATYIPSNSRYGKRPGKVSPATPLFLTDPSERYVLMARQYPTVVPNTRKPKPKPKKKSPFEIRFEE